MRYYLFIIYLFLFFPPAGIAQINYTANDQVPAYGGHFRFGTNMGAYANWNDEDLANIAAGNANLGIKGAGVRVLRPTLPEHFLEFWGYDIRANTFQHYQSLDVDDNVVFIGYPSVEHRDPMSYCPSHQSQLFENLYTDIWDGGANGTPVNDDNYYALYLYKMVSIYKDQVKFWEVWNEPDFDFSANGWKPKGEEGNWFENIPEPCDYSLRAPIFHYIRMLRISYEVIKFVDPTAYVAVGGLGFPSFLDLILRHSDNPDDGSLNASYPLGGGAYFDVLSYHSYPHFDGSLRYWSNDVGGFVHLRHSDAAASGVVNKKTEFQEVLNEYGYDGSSYPSKHWIITESNIPRLPFGEYIGSPEAQRNFLIKTLVACQQVGISQYHLFTIADSKMEANASNEFEVMGLFKKLEGTAPYEQKANPVAIAGRTTTQLIYKKGYDPMESQRLQLPATVGGGAFRSANGSYTYVLWAKTDTDRSEAAAANYSFPADMGIGWVKLRKWDFSKTGEIELLPASGLTLNAAPIFLKPTSGPTALPSPPATSSLQLFPNPGDDHLTIHFTNPQQENIQLELRASDGRAIPGIALQQYFSAGAQTLHFSTKDLTPGIYFLRWYSGQKQEVVKWVKW